MFPLEEGHEHIGNRTRVEILADILKVAANGALKTHIMYRANLSHRQLERYLRFLEERGLLAQFADDGTGTRTYRITNKGSNFLSEYSHISEYFSAKLA